MLCRDWSGLKWPPVWSSFEKTTVKRVKILTEKIICYTIVKNDPRVLLPNSEAEIRKLENFDFVLLLLLLLPLLLLLLLHHV